jgi:iron complex outermembrane receptor protein
MDTKIATLALAGVLTGAPAALAQEAGAVYNLGEIHVTAPLDAQDGRAAPAAAPAAEAGKGAPFQSSTPAPLGGDTVSAEKIETFDKTTLDKAVELTPGVVANDTAGSRNEQNIYVHGFDRSEVPLLLDGVRIYLPADNRLDFGRFLTGNISEIQISKGYASVLDGPGGLGGEINIVTRKPTQAVEAEVGSALDFGGPFALTGQRAWARLGTKQENYYLQAAGAWDYSRGWPLPEAYQGNSIQGTGLRDHSQQRDTSLNLKAGYTPNATDEYSINFLRTDGEKGAPYAVNYPIASQKYWTWPYWNTQSLALLTHTVIDPTLYVNTKFFWNRFDNALDMYSNAAQTLQNSPKAGYSPYHDWSLGGSVEVGKVLTDWDTVKAAFHYRRDQHNEQSQYFTTNTGSTTGCTANVVCYFGPLLTSTEDTYSAALENTIHATKTVDLVEGFSYDWRDLLSAEVMDTGVKPYAVRTFPSSTEGAPNGQLAAIWHYNDTDKLYLTLSDRVRFPTLFDRYSTRFNSQLPNPDLKSERALNLELGWDGYVAPRLKAGADVYYSHVDDMIQSVYITPTLSQSQNVGNANFVGADFKADYALNADLDLGGHVALIHRTLAVPASSGVQLTGVPAITGFGYVSWRPLVDLTVTPSVQIAGSRVTQSVSSSAPNYVYFQTGAYALLNVQVEYKAFDNLSFFAGGKNLTDRLYVLTDGYPEPGRTFYFGAKATF